MDRLSEAPPRENVRRRLRSELLTDEDFDAFCIDYFPGVAQRLSSGLNRVQKENLLLQMISPALINQRLKNLNVNEQNPWRLKTAIAVFLVVLVGAAVIVYRFMYAGHGQPNTPIQRGENSGQLGKTDPPAGGSAVPAAAKAPLPETTTLPLPLEPKAQPASPNSDIVPVPSKPSRPVDSKRAPPASRPGPVQVNRIHGNQGHVTIIQNNH